MARLFDRNREQMCAVYSRSSAIGFLILFFLTSLGFVQVAPFVKYAGLLQRITLLIGLAWMTFLPIHLLKHPSASQAAGRN